MIITVTGRIGSGKDTVIKLLNVPAHYTIIDADAIGHQLLTHERIIQKVGEIFPSAVVNGTINRKALAKEAFPDRVELLNAIMHPEITKEIKNKLSKDTLINAALLDALNLKEISNTVIFINTEVNVSIDRLKDTFSKEDVLNRIKSQKPVDWYLSHADIVLNNNGSLEDLKKEISTKCQNLF
ncbi:MAG: dephospho-CoA kinase [Candidatus Margulisbacteria bacterium GWF2_35_9]|nr:MAG: dephospho-CoA kinase [Candidatus Margulisbacteria bacterium GWF2_35_9]